MKLNISELWKSKALRDKRARQLRKHGYVVQRSSIRNKLLHPMYVEDLKGGVRTEDKGFGNTIYKTHFSVLYRIKDWK